MNRNGPKGFIYNHITSVRFDTYEFTLVYAEELDNRTPVFTHQHPFYEIYYTLDKYIRMKVKNETIELKKNELLIIARNIEHQVLFEPNCDYRYFVLIWDLFPVITQTCRGPEGAHEWEDLRQAMERIDKRQFIHSEVPFDGHQLLDVIQNELDRKQLAWNSSIVFKMYDFMIQALRHTVHIRITDQNLAGTLNLGIAANKYLHAHYAEPMTLEDVAKHLNYSSRHINRSYMKIFNTSIMKNLNLLRIEYAKQYLCLTDYSIEKISEIIGFSSSRTLYKFFRKHVEVSISQYRDKKLKQDKAIKTRSVADVKVSK